MSSPAGPARENSVVQRYQEMVAARHVSPDPAQLAVAQALDEVGRALLQRQSASPSGLIGRLLSKSRRSQAVRGLYIHGDVGRGKTMLMDLFYAGLPLRKKRRAHFNDFMADVHDRIQKQRERIKLGHAKEGDPVLPVAKALAEETSLLCFDEFSVTDIADAMILSRLFSALFDHGVTLVATSNVAPDNLYRDGLNRGLFTPFIAVLKKNAGIISLDSPTDYRRLKLARMKVYITPIDAQADAAMDEIWEAASEGETETTITLRVKGRDVHVRRAAGRAARFTFAELCEAPHGARDFIAISDRFDTVLIDHVPVMDDANRNAAKRFILLIDTFYDRGVRAIMSAAAAPEALYSGRIGAEAFEFARTASRLTEMQTTKWLEKVEADRRQAAE